MGLGQPEGLDTGSVMAQSSQQASRIWQGVSSANRRKRGKRMKRYQAPVVIATYKAKDLRLDAALVAVNSATGGDM